MRAIIEYAVLLTGGLLATGAAQLSLSQHTAKIATIEQAQASQEKTLERMDYNIQIIGRKVGVQPLRRPENE